MPYTSMKDTAHLLGVTYSALQSAVFHEKIPEPAMKVGAHRLFSDEELDSARRYLLRSGRNGKSESRSERKPREATPQIGSTESPLSMLTL